MSRTTERIKQEQNEQLKESIKDRWEEIYRSKLNLISKGSKYLALCPFHSEHTPSFNVFEGGAYHCFGCGKKGGDVIQFIMELENRTFVDVVTSLEKNFQIQPKSVIIRPPRIKQDILYEADYMPFTKKHHAYWNRYYLSEDFISREGDVYAVRNWAIDKKKQIIPDDEIMFAYIYKDYYGKPTGQLKFLRIGENVPKALKWRTNVPNTRIWYLHKYREKNPCRLFIAKSNKDSLVNMMAGIASVATQSENDKILSVNIPLLKEVCPNLVLNFGSDDQGRDMSISVSKEWNLPWFNTPKSYLRDGINDNAEYQAEFGPECFKQLLKDKNYLCHD